MHREAMAVVKALDEHKWDLRTKGKAFTEEHVACRLGMTTRQYKLVLEELYEVAWEWWVAKYPDSGTGPHKWMIVACWWNDLKRRTGANARALKRLKA